MSYRSLSEDLVGGAKAIGAELGVDERRAFHLLERGHIPGFKLGGRWYARRSRLRLHIERLEQSRPSPDHGDVA